jgi:hypothetical protein
MTAATEMIPNAPRVVGVATNYLELIQSFRARLAELEISYETLDEIAGWTTRYGSKLLASEPSRNLGPIALDAMLGATGLKIALIEDRERLERSSDISRFCAPKTCRAYHRQAPRLYRTAKDPRTDAEHGFRGRSRTR